LFFQQKAAKTRQEARSIMLSYRLDVMDRIITKTISGLILERSACSAFSPSSSMLSATPENARGRISELIRPLAPQGDWTRQWVTRLVPLTVMMRTRSPTRKIWFSSTACT